MTRYVLGRVGGAGLLLLGVSFFLYAMVSVAPGDPITVLTGGRSIPPERLDQLREYYHLDEPFLNQYVLWLRSVLSGDLGVSVSQQAAVTDVISPRIAPTMWLGVYAGALVFVFGFCAGFVSALKRGRSLDVVLSGGMLVAASIAPYVSGILLIVVFAQTLGWFPTYGSGEGFVDSVYHLTLPAVALAVSLSAFIGRISRASMIDALEADYVDTARSRGLSSRNVLLRHALRTALVPIVTVGGVTVGYLFTGAIVIEYTFGLNGLGSTLIQAILAKDFALVQAIALLFVLVFVAANLLTDLAVMFIDPRQRLQRRVASS